MRRLAAVIAALAMASAPALANPGAVADPLAAPEPGVLLAQVDDSDLKDEESLEFLQNLEFQKDAWSLGAGVGLSLIPGAGWGLIYAEKPAQSTVPFLLSAIGYGVGALYMAGVFDESSTQICSHVRDGRVNDAECTYADVVLDPNNPDQVDNNDIDPRDPDMRPYFATRSDYEVVTRGEDFDGTTTGIIIIGATYVVTTVIGAAWAGATVSAHNDQLRKDIESTASRGEQRPISNVRPVIGYTGERGLFGVALDF